MCPYTVQHVIEAVEVAATTAEELANMGGGLQKERVQQLCKNFLTHIKVRATASDQVCTWQCKQGHHDTALTSILKSPH